jgi:hypothetical protein
MRDIIPQSFHKPVHFLLRSLFGDGYQKLILVSKPVKPYTKEKSLPYELLVEFLGFWMFYGKLPEVFSAKGYFKAKAQKLFL